MRFKIPLIPTLILSSFLLVSITATPRPTIAGDAVRLVEGAIDYVVATVTPNDELLKKYELQLGDVGPGTLRAVKKMVEKDVMIKALVNEIDREADEAALDDYWVNGLMGATSRSLKLFHRMTDFGNHPLHEKAMLIANYPPEVKAAYYRDIAQVLSMGGKAPAEARTNVIALAQNEESPFYREIRSMRALTRWYEEATKGKSSKRIPPEDMRRLLRRLRKPNHPLHKAIVDIFNKKATG